MIPAFKAFDLFPALPKHDPLITGLKHFYEFGELVSANCTSDMSSPPASLTWYLNDEKVSLTNKLDVHTYMSFQNTKLFANFTKCI